MMLPANPYIAGAPLRGEKGFFGRQDTLDWVQQELRNPQTNALVLFGQRRIGKTTLLLQLARSLPSNEFLPVYFDLQDQSARPLGQTLADLADTLCEKTGLSSCQPANFDDQGRYFQKEFLPEVYAALGEERRPILLLDEFDVLDQTAEAALAENATAKALFPLLRRLMTTDPRPAFVFVVGRRAEDLSLDFSATFKASLVREVWVLDDSSAEALVRQAQANDSLRFTDRAVERILSLASRHPYLTQLLCQRVWELAYTAEPASSPLIDTAQVESAVESALEAGNQALEWLWSGLNPAEKIYASALAEIAGEDETILEDRIIQVLAEHAARLRTREIELAPRDLVKRHVLEASSHRSYRFAVELFRRWVQKNKPLLAVKDEIDRVDPMADRLYVIGDGFYDARKWERAAFYFHEALNVNPRHFRARLYLGEALLEQGQIDQAIAELDQALVLDREEARLPLARAWLAKATLLKQADDTDAVLKAYERVLELSPREGQALEGRAAVWKQRAQEAEGRGELIAALEAYRQAGDQENISRLEPQVHERGLADLEAAARQHAAAGRWEAAEVAYARLVSEALDESSRLAWQAELDKATVQAVEQLKVLVQAYLERDEWDKAFQVYENLIQRQGAQTWQPALDQARLERQMAEMFDQGRQALQQEDWKEAQRLFAQLIQQRPDYRRHGLLAAALLQDAIMHRKGRGSQEQSWLARLSGSARKPTPPLAPSSLEESVGQPAQQITPARPAVVWLFIVSFIIALLLLTFAALSIDKYVQKPYAIGDSNLEITARPQEVITASNAGQLSELGHWYFKENASDIAISPDSTLLAASAHEGFGFYRNYSIVVDLGTGKVRQVFYRHSAAINSVALSPDASLLATGFEDKTITIWNVGSGEPLRTMAGHLDEVTSVAFSPDGSQLASASVDNTIRIWNVSDGSQLKTLYGHGSSVYSVVYSPDGLLLASASYDKNIIIWRVSDGSLLRTLEGHTDTVWDAAFSPDGTLLASASNDNTVKIWNVSDGSWVRTLARHTNYVNGVAFSPDGSLLASTSVDNTMRIWQVSDGTLLISFDVAATTSHALFTPDGKLLLVIHNGNIYFWGVASTTKTPTP